MSEYRMDLVVNCVTGRQELHVRFPDGTVDIVKVPTGRLVETTAKLRSKLNSEARS